MGAYDAAQVVWIVEMWQEKASPFIQAQHFFYAVGSIIPSLLFSTVTKLERPKDPFEALLGEKDDFSLAELNLTKEDFLGKGNGSRGEEIYIVPYMIGGSMNTIACLLQVSLFIFARYKKPPMYQQNLNNQNLNLNLNNSPDKKSELSVEVNDTNNRANSLTKLEPGSSSSLCGDIVWTKIRLVALTGIFLGMSLIFNARQIAFFIFL